MSKPVKVLIAVLVAATAASIVAMAFMAASRGDQDEDEEEAVKAPSHVSLQNGHTVIHLDAPTRNREGIQVSTLKPTTQRAEVHASAVLLPVNDLASSRSSYIAARAQLERDQVDLDLARKQSQRVKSLYDQNQNMSLKAVQDAEAAVRKNQAQEVADEQEVRLQVDAIRQRWGNVVAAWVTNNSSALEAVLTQGRYLAQVTFPPGEVAKAPATVSLIDSANRAVPARLVSALAQVTPQIQGISFLYLVGGNPEMAVGMNLAVLVPIGQRLSGTVIPQSAIVWWEGKAWVYEESAPDTFTRREIPTQTPTTGGYFTSETTFAPGTKLVTAGAQILLSEEFRGEIQQED
ncbi:MAG TPA: hypothetical protein VKT29_02365 [Terriglobales bacterium]|nr:hypothetical protein [Terriglobales bacterium]